MTVLAAPTTVTGMGIATIQVSLDSAVIAVASRQARLAGISMSAWVARSIKNTTIVEGARRYQRFDRMADDADAMKAWDAQHRVGHRLAGAEW
ncbi:MAG: hypothetical protein JXA67_07215 [Micromonosporaceae bacterium]|nr:hypothetical protein [Micromonosporaceae bacterium]